MVETIALTPGDRVGWPWPHVVVVYALRFATRRRRDTGNYVAMADKLIGDGLVAAGVVANDTAAEVFPIVRWDEGEVGSPQTTIAVWPVPQHASRWAYQQIKAGLERLAREGYDGEES